MRFSLALSFIFIFLTACENSQVEMYSSSESELTSVSISLGSSYLDVTPAGSNEIFALSRHNNPTFVRNSYFPDANVRQLDFYTSADCSGNYLGFISNQEGAPNTLVAQGFLGNGTHPIFYKPFYTDFNSQLFAMCIPARITYIVDSQPPAPSFSPVSPFDDWVTSRSVNITNCISSSVTEASSFFISETDYATPETQISDSQWMPCEADGSTTAALVVNQTPPQANRYFLVYTKDKIGNVLKSYNFYNMQTPPMPILEGAGVYHLGLGDPGVISLVNTGASIQTCSSPTALPSWISLVPSLNECTLYVTTTSAQNEVTINIMATANGNVSNTVSLKVSVNKAQVSFGVQGLEPTIRPWMTELTADVFGLNLTHYSYRLGTNTDCTDPTGYSGWRTLDIKMTEDLHTADGAVRFVDGTSLTLCVLGKTISGHNQILATKFSWVKLPQILPFDVLQADTYFRQGGVSYAANVFSPIFKVDANTTKIGCDANCSFRIAASPVGFTSAAERVGPHDEAVNPGEYVQFKVVGAVGSGIVSQNTITRFVGTVPTNYYFQIKTHEATCSGNYNSIFLTKRKYSGNLSGVAGADTICQNEAAYFSVPNPGQWRALIYQGNGSPFLSRLEMTESYCSYPLARRIAQNQSFIGAITHFVDGTNTNGGGLWAWSQIFDTYRISSSGTRIWVGDNNKSCSNWTNGTVSASGRTSELRHQANYNNSYWSGDFDTPATQSTCDEMRHLLCYYNTP